MSSHTMYDIHIGIKEGILEFLMEAELAMLRKESLKRTKNVQGSVSMGYLIP